MPSNKSRSVRRRARLFFLFPMGFVLTLAACEPAPRWEERDFRQDMRDFVVTISTYAKSRSPGFFVIPQNGHELATLTGTADGDPAFDYLAAVDGQGREDLFFGYEADDAPTPASDAAAMTSLLDLEEDNGVQVLVTDYCRTPSYVDESYRLSSERGYVSLAADSRDLDTIPGYPDPLTPNNVHAATVTSLGDVRNFLYVLDPSGFADRSAYLSSLGMTNYDLIILDFFHEDAGGAATPLTTEELDSIRTKANGGGRLLAAYLSIGEAEDYRYYWEDPWSAAPPSWLAGENPDWPGNYKVRYWDPGWQSIIFGSDESYLDRIMAAGFDGVYLDIIDAYEFFER